jgi:hypothetical protein
MFLNREGARNVPYNYVIPATECHEPRCVIRDLADLEIANTLLVKKVFTLGDPGSPS